MKNFFWLTERQTERVRPFLSKSYRKIQVDHRRMLSGILFGNHNGLPWCDALREYFPPITTYIERHKFLRSDDRGSGQRRRQGDNFHDRRDVSQDARHGFKLADEKGGSATGAGV